MLRFKWNKGLEDFADAHYIRETVFIEEQGFDSEFDETDKTAYHLTAYYVLPLGEKEIAVATARIFNENNSSEYHIGRVAVLKDYRGKHFGEALMREAMRKAAELGATALALGSQKQAEYFYEKLGFKAFGEEYLDQLCPHINMRFEI